MYIMRNLPSTLALLAAVSISLLGIYYGNSLEAVSINLIIGIIAFYASGYILRNLFFSFLLKVLDESERKAKALREIEREKNAASGKNAEDEEELEPYLPEKL